MIDPMLWRGLRALVSDAVEQGALAVERVHLETARRPFEMLELIPAVSEQAQNLREVHDTIVQGVYSAVRITNQMVAKTFDALEAGAEREPATPR
jgi:hypothetical protein